MNSKPELLESKRYRGHVSLDGIGPEGQRAISRARVAVVGAGGLGSPVVLYLAAAGVGEMTIIDADKVELSNLQRQVMHAPAEIGSYKAQSAARAALRLNPGLRVNAVTKMLAEDNAAELLAGCDVVADCTDSPASRLMLSRVCRSMGKPLCVGTVSRFAGQVFTQLPTTAGFADFFGAGESVGESCARVGILNTLVGVVGSLQATEVLKVICNAGDLLTDRFLHIDTAKMDFRVFRI